MPAAFRLPTFVLISALAASAFAQGGRFDGAPGGRAMTPEEIKQRMAWSESFLANIDANRNGVIDPEEAQGQQRFWVERVLRRAGLEPNFPMPISQVRDRLTAAYQPAAVNGAAPTSSPAVAGFGPPGAAPGLGSTPSTGWPTAPAQAGGSQPEITPEVTEKIRQLASSIIAKYDREKKGKLTRDEWPQGPLGTFDEANRFRGEFITIEELIVHLTDLYRQNRVPSGLPGGDLRAVPPGVPAVPGFGPPVAAPAAAPAITPQPAPPSVPPSASVRPLGSPAKAPSDADVRVRELASTIIQRYDRENKGKLTRDEWPAGRWGTFDEANRGKGNYVTMDELVTHLSDLHRQDKLVFSANGTRSGRFLSPRERLPSGLPDWFMAKDQNGDGQVAMAEFASDWNDSTVVEFSRYDLNHDGIITPHECLEVEDARKVEQAEKGGHRQR
jgi:hypothetical protein